ncbi:MAG: quinolinate synthase NadA [Candidatus Methanoplasma sp.]|jgi:quinolinate synthase|nr:quinolinate synthase NadA [Candidatus Methanoplasma sp.]
MATVSERILRLKKEKNAVILAHNYTSSDVQDLADYVGDSLGLSIKAAATEADVIVFCGVSFMGETAKILSPGKTVLLPEPEAHCAMASMCNADQIRQIKIRNPGSAVVGYVNSTAESKGEMDICCTSSNAVAVVNSLKEENIVFVPDKNLGAYVASHSAKNITLWDGFCPVHQSITVKQVKDLLEKHPGAKILAHPECRTEVLDLADGIGSTEKILNMSVETDAEEFIILTEVGMRHRLEALCPGKRFYFPVQAVCMTMKMIEPESILHALETNEGEVVLGTDVLKKAYLPVKRMTELIG